MGNLCGGPANDGKVEYLPDTIFKKRYLAGDMTPLAFEEHQKEQKLF